MVELLMSTSLEFWRWMPSVLGLSAGEAMVMFFTLMPPELSNLRWHCGLLLIRMLRTVEPRIQMMMVIGQGLTPDDECQCPADDVCSEVMLWPSTVPAPWMLKPWSHLKLSHWSGLRGFGQEPMPGGASTVPSIWSVSLAPQGPWSVTGETRNLCPDGSSTVARGTRHATRQAAASTTYGTSESSVTPSAAAPKDKTLNVVVLPGGDLGAATAGAGDARHRSAPPANNAAETMRLHISLSACRDRSIKL
ncbi:hypothetical protein U9M48_018761 [Paspalum notatum var. saurae]|uniref:Uncharacterized protein n=1 Tax=Paspalum notatum var. saurae TaxID=547442 RepID=A0AAQ3TDT0_PASNO